MPSYYIYKCKRYFPSDEDTDKIIRTVSVFSDRSEIVPDAEYYTSYVCVYTDNKEIERFNFGISYSCPGSLIKNRCEDRVFLNFITDGKGVFNGKPISKGQMYYTLPLEAHSVRSDRKEPYSSVWMSIEGTYAQHIMNELKKMNPNDSPTLRCSADIMSLSVTLLCDANLGEMSCANLKALINLYLSYIIPNVDGEQTDSLDADRTVRLVKESKSYVRKNLKTVTVASMAADQHYNKKYFSRIFSEAMGMTPMEYITDCRLEWAKNSLIHSNLSIAKITEAIGYNHRNGFYIAFKKKYGCNPTECRKQNASGASEK